MPHSNDVEEVHRASATPSYHHVATYINPHQSPKHLSNKLEQSSEKLKPLATQRTFQRKHITRIKVRALLTLSKL